LPAILFNAYVQLVFRAVNECALTQKSSISVTALNMSP